MLAYKVRNLTKVYDNGKVVANDGLSFDIEQGEIFGLLGPNGAGKTTLVRQMMGLVKPTAGHIEIFSIRLTPRNLDRIPWYVSYTPQRLGAVADLTAYEGLCVTGHLRGMARQDSVEQAEYLIEEFQLGYLGNRPIGKMSGGEQRLIVLCMGLMASRPIMILDEPTNDLDPAYRKKVWEKLMEVNHLHKTTIILVTHNVMEAEKVLSRVGIINKGKIQALGTVGSLKAQIDQRVRIDVRFRPDADKRVEPAFYSSFEEVECRLISDHEALLLVPRHQVQQVIDKVISDVPMMQLDDLRIISPTLEDVYLQLGGGERLEREAS